MEIAERVLAVLAETTEVEEVRRNLEMRLYDEGILDSLRTVELMIAFEKAFGLNISPAELDREQWATPSRIVEDLTSRLAPSPRPT